MNMQPVADHRHQGVAPHFSAAPTVMPPAVISPTIPSTRRRMRRHPSTAGRMSFTRGQVGKVDGLHLLALRRARLFTHRLGTADRQPS